MKRLALLLLAAAACSPAATEPAHVASPAAATPAGLTPGEADASAHVTAASIDAPLRYLSDDLLEGRGPGTRGDDLAIKYIAAEMEAMGLQPGASEGGGQPSWFQKVPLVGFKSQLPATETFASTSSPSETVTLNMSSDLILGTGVQQPKVAFDAPDVVFVGYGIVAPEYHWDDYKNVDVKGKVVLVMNNDPESDPTLFEGTTRLWYGRWDYKYLEAAKHGAAGALIIHTTHSAAYPWQRTLRAPHESGRAARARADVGHRGCLPEDREARRQGPRRAPRRGGEARVRTGAARREDVARVHERAAHDR
jgi:hypothetical protein